MTSLKQIHVVPYDPLWPKIFEAEEACIKQRLGEHVQEIHHIGSTAVPGLRAKEDIDILCIMQDLSRSLSLEKEGYTFKGEFNIPGRYFFTKSLPKKVNMHVVEPDHGFIALNLAFRDYVRCHEEVRNAYATLKEDVLKDPTSYHKLKGHFTQYTLRKNVFIKDVLKKAEYKGRIMTFCLHHEEWEAAKRMRQAYFFDAVPVEDPYTWTFDHPDHKHLVFYKGGEIVGYAHLQLWPNQRVALRIIVIDFPFRNQGLGSYFLGQCERWGKEHGYKTIHTGSSPEVLGFYEKQGYIPMPFEDPEGHTTDPRDTPLGKRI